MPPLHIIWATRLSSPAAQVRALALHGPAVSNTFPGRRKSAQSVSANTHLLFARRVRLSSRNSLIVTPPASGGPPRHRCRRRRIHGPTGRSVLGERVPGEIPRDPLENLHLKF